MFKGQNMLVVVGPAGPNTINNTAITKLRR
jgi:hypothetical protein